MIPVGALNLKILSQISFPFLKSRETLEAIFRDLVGCRDFHGVVKAFGYVQEETGHDWLRLSIQMPGSENSKRSRLVPHRIRSLS